MGVAGSLPARTAPERHPAMLTLAPRLFVDAAARLQVCCSESSPAWLMVNLGALRPIAALSVFFAAVDLTYSLALGNSSAGPWVTVAHAVCAYCVQNYDYAAPLEKEKEGWGPTTFALGGGAPAVASHVLLTVTWSSMGGVGGCADLCDFASNINSLRAWSPGVVPVNPAHDQVVALLARVKPEPDDAPCASVQGTSSVMAPASSAADVALIGAASLGPPASLVVTASSVVADSAGLTLLLNTPEQTAVLGAAAFTRVIEPGVDCPCAQSSVALHRLLITAFVRLGGGAWPGEGFVLSLVDASRQTPGAMRFLRGCGVRDALPAHALSIVFDTSDSGSDPGCDEVVGTGVRLVSTLAGAAAPPRVLASTLPGATMTATSRFRTGGWVPVQVTVMWTSATNFAALLAADGGGGSVAAQAAAARMADANTRPSTISMLYLDGDAVLTGHPIQGAVLSDMAVTNTSLSRFHVVVSARSAAAAAPVDGHAVASVRVDCVSGRQDWIVNDAGFRQPLTPPPAQWL